MKALRFLILMFLFCNLPAQISAQSVQEIENLEFTYKECLLTKKDTSNCGKTFLRQMDSVLFVVSELVRGQLPASKKADYLKEQFAWFSKKDEFNKKQDENFVYNLKEGIWMPNMIWLVYQNKAEFLKKRAVTLAKKID